MGGQRGRKDFHFFFRQVNQDGCIKVIVGNVCVGGGGGVLRGRQVDASEGTKPNQRNKVLTWKHYPSAQVGSGGGGGGGGGGEER